MEGLATGKPGRDLRQRTRARHAPSPGNAAERPPLHVVRRDRARPFGFALTMGDGPRGPTPRGDDGWQRSVDEVVDVLSTVQSRPLNYARIVKRQKALSNLV